MAGSDLSIDRAAPEVAYTAMDRATILDTLLTFELANEANYPGLETDLSPASLTYRMINRMSVLGDLVFYRLDVIARELFVATARERVNLAKIAKPLGYNPYSAESASVDLTMTLDPSAQYPLTISRAEQYSNGSTIDEVFFQPTNDFPVAAFGGGTVVVPCTEGELYQNVLLSVSNGGASQRVQFPQTSVVLSSVLITVNGVLWSPVLDANGRLATSWSGIAAATTSYVLKYDDNGRVYLVFGDGAYGAIPAANATVLATFRVGGGTRGNLPAATITTIVNGNEAVLSVTNVAASDGGQNFETVSSIRNSIAATLTTLYRAVSEQDHALIAESVAGVAKALAAKSTVGARTVNITAALEGGGPLDVAHKVALSLAFKTRKIASMDIVSTDFIYKNLVLSFILYINPAFQASVVETTTRNFITMADGTGRYDFDQLAPAALDAFGELLLSQTILQGWATTPLQAAGLSRLTAEKFTIRASARARPEGNVGNGGIADGDIVVSGVQRRREFVLTFVTETTYNVIERINGYITSMTDSTLTDESKDFTSEGVASFVGYRLAPSRDSFVTAPVVSVAPQIISVSIPQSLFSITSPGDEYYLFNPAGTFGTVASQFTSVDGTVKFTVQAGGQNFVPGDSFSIDVFPNVADIRLRADEYPQLLLADFKTRTVGGIS